MDDEIQRKIEFHEREADKYLEKLESVQQRFWPRIFPKASKFRNEYYYAYRDHIESAAELRRQLANKEQRSNN